MSARNVNLVIEQNVDFEATFTIRNANNSPLNLTGYSALAKIRKHPDATKYTDFVISFPNRINGVVKVALAVTSTATLEGGRYVYDLVLVSPNNYKTRPIAGNVLVLPGVS